ncbi:hypothetical protein AB0K16_22600 [Nonomuraea jabiensis]|uniref:hypothetical protein n=1 Tax=Nonomuraea jabiensis TaxID=882448 RepID=UPI00344A47B9
MTRKYKPGEVLGYRKNGSPIRVIAGGSGEVPPTNTPAPSLEVPPAPAPQPLSQPVPQAPTQDPNVRYFTADEVERFRAQERDKLYPQLQQLQERVSSFEAERETARQAEQERIRAEEDAARQAREEEMSVRQLLEEREREWETRFAALEKERLFNELQAYIQRRVREESDGQTIAPELLDLVNGSSPEEVEASIARLREKTSAIVSNMQAAASQMAAPPAPPRGVTPAGYAATGPMDMHSERRDVTPEEIRQMSWDDYKEFRKNFGFGKASVGQGIFG